MQNNLFIISGPSGAGEDSIINGLVKRGVDLERVITTTSRDKRSGEKDGEPYYFIRKKEFKLKIENNDFFEWAEEYGNYYGVTQSEIERVKNLNKIGIWKMGYKGVRTAKKLLPNIKSILINAPLNQIENRIRTRDKNVTEQFIEDRMEYTKEWLKHISLYDYVVMNLDGRLNQAVEEVFQILKK